MIREVACSDFVKRQTKESGHSHFEGTWDELAGIASSLIHTGHRKEGYKKGVVLIEVPEYFYDVKLLDKFYSATVTITDKTKLLVNYAPRQEGEDPFIRVCAKAKKQRAKAAEIICYHKDVLDEDDDRSTSAEWEIVAIKARASKEEEPMDPMTMARNFLHLKGGTKGEWTAEQFAKSIVYWNRHCISAGSSKWYRKLLTWFK